MQQRMTFADNWNTLEQVCLASAVRLHGDHETNWSAVCKYLKSKFAPIDRPGNWFTPESCEAQYKWLSDKYVKMEISCERPVIQILQNLKQIGECESKPVLDQERTYNELKNRLELIANNEVDNEIIMEFYDDSCKRNREREENMKKQGLKNDSPNVTKSSKQDNKTDGTSPTTTSPLLSSLLNNPPAAQYRPILSTASFIPNKTTQGTSRTSFERSHPTDSSQRGSYSPTLGSQSSSLGERASSFNTSAASPARKLDFQDPSTSATSHDHISATKETHKDTSWSNEPTKSDVNNLENINLIPTNEEIDPDILLQVIGNLQGKQALDKVLDELTGEKESIIEKDLNTVTIPLDETFVPDSPTAKNAVQILTLPAASKTSAVNTEFESLGHQYAATEDVIIIEEESSSEQVTDDTNATGVEQSTLVATAPMNSDSSISLTIDCAPESASSESKFDSEPLVEYLDTSSVEQPDEEIVQSDEKIEAKLDVGKAKVDSANDAEKELVEKYEHGTPKTLETLNASDNGEPSDVVTLDDEVEQPTSESIELQVEQTKEIPKESETKEVAVVYDASPTIVQFKDTFDLANVPVTDFEPTEKEDTTKTETDESLRVQEDVEPEQQQQQQQQQQQVPKTEEAIVAEPSKISKPIPQIEQTVDTNVSLTTLAPTVGELSSTSTADDKLNDVKSSPRTEMNESLEAEKSAVKSRRQLPRRRRSTASDSNEPPKIMKIEDTEVPAGVEEVDVKKDDSVRDVVNDSQADVSATESLVKIEDVEEPAAPAVQTPLTKAKSANRNADARKSKSKSSISRRSSIRSQNQNLLTPKSEETTMASPSTPSSSRTGDSAAASKCKKSLVLSQQRLASQKYSSAFLKPISNKTVPGYEDLIYSPIDLHTIKKKIDTKVMKTVAEFEKDVLLMILNAKMFNRVNPQVYNMAVEMQKEALREIQLTVKTLGEGVLLEIEDDITEKARKRQAVESLKKEQKSNKRSKAPTKDESSSAKRIKLEENEPAP